MVRPAWLNIGWTNHSVSHYLYHISIICITFIFCQICQNISLFTAYKGPNQRTAQSVLQMFIAFKDCFTWNRLIIAGRIDINGPSLGFSSGTFGVYSLEFFPGGTATPQVKVKIVALHNPAEFAMWLWNDWQKPREIPQCFAASSQTKYFCGWGNESQLRPKSFGW